MNMGLFMPAEYGLYNNVLEWHPGIGMSGLCRWWKASHFRDGGYGAYLTRYQLGKCILHTSGLDLAWGTMLRSSLQHLVNLCEDPGQGQLCPFLVSKGSDEDSRNSFLSQWEIQGKESETGFGILLALESASKEAPGIEDQVIKMFSLCFIELQQMSNKLEKITLSKLPSILFVQCTQTRWGQCRGWGGGLQTQFILQHSHQIGLLVFLV